MTIRASIKARRYTIQQLAPLLHMSRATLTRIVRDRLKIKPESYVWKGKRWRLTEEDVQQIIAAVRPSMRERVMEAARESGVISSS